MKAANHPAPNITPFTSILINLAGITPPSWAVSYDLLRTNNLTYSKYFNWVSKRTLSGVDPALQVKYGYIDITNIDDFNIDQQASTPNVTYGFEIGDRIRFNAIYVPGVTTSYLTNDYSVVGEAIDPIVNGQQQQGRFVKILFPSSDITGTFNLIDDYHFANYNITLYHSASNAGPETANAGSEEVATNVYYTIGYTFGIGNPGLNTAYHFGNIANNQIQVQDGDFFYRQRTVPIGSSYYFYGAAVAFSGRYATAILTPNPSTITVAGQYATGAQAYGAADPFVATNYPSFGAPGGMFQNLSTLPINYRARGSFTVSSEFVTWVDIVVKMVNAANNVITVTILAHSQGVGNGTTTIDTITVGFDGTFTVPAGYKAWLILGNGEINPGTTNTHFGGFMMRTDVIQNITIQCFDKSYSDTYNLVVNSDDQPVIADPTQKRLEYTTMYRWGQADQLNSTTNGINRFYFTDYDEAVKMYGAIVKLSTIGKLLHVFHERKFGTVGIYQQYIKTNTGEQQLVVSDTIITKNNIRYEIYDGGIANQKGCVVIANYAHYCVDPVKGFILRWSLDGVVIISLLYKCQTWPGNNLPNYLNSYTNQFGGDARILGAFKIVKNNNSIYMMMAQSGTNGTGSVDGRTLIFDETDNAFESFYNIDCDGLINAENTLYSAFGGVIYIHDDQSTKANFFGVQYPSSIDLVFNEKLAITKKFLCLGYQADQWFLSPSVGDIITSFINPQTGFRQISQLIQQDGEIYEGKYVFAFLRDANSGLNAKIALLEGDYLMGQWIMVHLVYSGGQDGFFFAPYITYEDSPRNF